jgi:hypothetical protein
MPAPLSTTILFCINGILSHRQSNTDAGFSDDKNKNFRR